MPSALGMSGLKWLFVDIYSALQRNALGGTPDCNWELGYLAMQWREEPSTDKRFLMIFLHVLKQLVTFPAPLQSSGAALLGCV